LLGLEAAKAMLDLEQFGKVKLIDRNRWVLARQLDGDAGSMVVEQVRALGVDVLLQKRVQRILTNEEENEIRGVLFEDGEEIECACICFAVCFLFLSFLSFCICMHGNIIISIFSWCWKLR